MMEPPPPPKPSLTRSPPPPPPSTPPSFKKKTTQLEEELQDDLKWSIEVKKVLHSGKSDFQSVELVDSGPFGKVRRKERG